jgi:tripartite-type tricarboxylate transporter receptor subunit TctC
MVIYTWFGFLGPAAMPKAIVNKLHSEVVKAIASPAVKERLQGAELIGSSPEQFSHIVESDMKRWANVVKAAGIQRE